MAHRAFMATYALAALTAFGWAHNGPCAFIERVEKKVYRSNCEYSIVEFKDKHCLLSASTGEEQRVEPLSFFCSFALAATWPVSLGLMGSSKLFEARWPVELRWKGESEP